MAHERLRGSSKEGEPFYPGQEPVLAEGVRGLLMDEDSGVFIPAIYAEQPGMGDVARFLDALPKDRRIVFPTVLSGKLRAMLLKRGYENKIVVDPRIGSYEAMVRDPSG